MARTKADSCTRKAVAAKAPRKIISQSTKSRSGRNVWCPKSNRYCPRPTPSWQRDINTFFTPCPKEVTENHPSGTETRKEPSDDDIVEAGPANDLNQPGPSKVHESSDESD